MKRKVIAIWELNGYVNRLLEDDYMLSDIWLAGEISNCKYHQSGHVYFTLKDERASISAVLFARDAKLVPFKLIEGMKVYARAHIALYEKSGMYQAYIHSIEQQGIGSLYEEFEKLKKRLLEEGLFEEAHKKAIPSFPRKVGVITSSTGAAIKDILQVAKRRNPAVEMIIYPVHVQGKLSAPEMVNAIKLANLHKKVDVIILARGGGSIEDLWSFNEEIVAKAIFDSDLPVVSGIGHEVDFTIADFVSDKRAPTPSAAAELVVPSREQYMQQIQRSKEHLHAILSHMIKAKKTQLNALTTRPSFRMKEKYFQIKMQEVDEKVYRLNTSYERCLQRQKMQYQLLVEKLAKLSPFATFARGYSIVTNNKGEIIRQVTKVQPKDTLKVQVSDGSFMVEVVEGEEKNA